MNGLLYVILFVFGCGIGLLLGSEKEPNWPLIFAISCGAAFLLFGGRDIYVMYRTKNMASVEKLLSKWRKRPYIAVLLESLDGHYESAEKHIPKIKNEQQKAMALTPLLIQKRQLEQAAAENQKIKNDDARHYNDALIALLKGERERFRLSKDKVKSGAFRTVLMAEEAYRDGDLKEAERLGSLAISMSAGVKRWVLLKALERERKNPGRDSYF